MAVRRFLTDEAIINLLFEDSGGESDDDGEERLGVPSVVNDSNLYELGITKDAGSHVAEATDDSSDNCSS